MHILDDRIQLHAHVSDQACKNWAYLHKIYALRKNGVFREHCKL